MNAVGITAKPEAVMTRPLSSTRAMRRLCCSQCSSCFAYWDCRVCMPCRSQRLSLPMAPGRRPPPGANTRAQAIGVKLSAFRVENRIAPLMARAIG